jgi:uncharacterized protein YdaU (DUF1376 family)
MENGAKVGDNGATHDGGINASVRVTQEVDAPMPSSASHRSTPDRSPAFQFYPKDFLTDENVVVMSLLERGAYITLICQCWIDGTIPADPERLAKMCGSPLSAFRKLWPALERCFVAARNTPDRLIHPRLERERKKQADFRARQAENGAKGGRPTKPTAKPTESQEKGLGSSGLTQTEPTKSSSSSVSDLRSSDFSQKAAAPTEARSKRPIYTSDRFAVFEWQFDDLGKMLGGHFEAFDLHAFFDALSQQSRASGLVIPKLEAWPWLQAQVLAEAKRRKLPIASAEPVRDKAAEQRAQDERILALVQEGRRAGR